MLVQVVLIVLIVGIVARFVVDRGASRTSAYKKLALIAFVLCAVLAVLIPDAVTKVAKLVGVGRGADLLLYALTVIIIFQTLNGYLKEKDENRRLVALARRLAILEARLAGQLPAESRAENMCDD